MKHPSVTKAVFPIAGLATRMLPTTKAISKEMLPVHDRPLIEFAMIEAINAGIEEFIFVIGPGQNQISQYFAENRNLTEILQRQGRTEILEILGNLYRLNDAISYVIQDQPWGLGHAVLCAKKAVGDQDFAVISPDDLLVGGGLSQLQSGWNDTAAMQVLVEQVAPQVASHYGIVGFSDEGTGRLNAMVEKPQNPPSHWGIIGRYIFPNRIFCILDKQRPGHKGEIQLTDAMVHLMDETSAYAQKYHGNRLDCGSLAGWRAANQLLGSGAIDVPPTLSSVIRESATFQTRQI